MPAIRCLRVQVIEEEATAAASRHFLDTQQYHSTSEWLRAVPLRTFDTRGSRGVGSPASLRWHVTVPQHERVGGCQPRARLLHVFTRDGACVCVCHPAAPLTSRPPPPPPPCTAGIQRYERVFGPGFVSPGGLETHKVLGWAGVAALF